MIKLMAKKCITTMGNPVFLTLSEIFNINIKFNILQLII